MTDVQHTPDRLFLRQSGIFNPLDHEEAKVTFVGVGGTGSFAATAVAKLGIPNITLIDPDVCEYHNIPNQFYTLHSGEVEDAKVHALKNQLAEHIGCNAEAYVGRIGPHGWEVSEGRQLPPEPEGVVVSGVDSMKARKWLWENKVNLNPAVSRFIDPRLDGRRILIYTVDPTNLEDCEKYEATLVDDAAIPDTACTERGLIDVGFMVGALICHQVRCHFNGDADLPNIIHHNQQTLKLDKGAWL